MKFKILLSVMLIYSSSAHSLDFNFISVKNNSELVANYQSASDINTIDPLTSKTNIYQQIYSELNDNYLQIGNREARRILAGNNLDIFGGLNSIGFNYRKSFIDFSIAVDRSLAPDLFDNKRWIVTDSLSIYIDASRMLSNLKKQDLIDISEKNLALFAGVVFKRTFTWVHFSSSYQEGLQRDFEKLFFPFRAFEFSNISKISPNELIYKEDSLSYSSGGVVTSPIYQGVSGAVGVLSKFSKMSKVEVISKVEEKLANKILVTSEKTKLASVGANFMIQADFFKILKMTLLSYDFNYELESSYKIYLSFDESEFKTLRSDNPVSIEIEQILKSREGDIETLKKYIISEEKKIALKLEHKYNFLLLGGGKSSRTQQIEVVKDGHVKNFFRHYYEKIRYTESLVSRLFASVIYAIANTESSAAKVASDSKKVTLEYDSESNLLDMKKDLAVDDFSTSHKLSLTFTTMFETKKTLGKSGKKYKDQAKFLLERFSGVDPMIINFIDSDHFKAPMSLSGNYQVYLDGVKHFNNLPNKDALEIFDQLCEESPRNKFFNFRSIFDNCKRTIENDFIDYKLDLTHKKITNTDVEYCEEKSHEIEILKRRKYVKICLEERTLKGTSEQTTLPLWQLKNVVKDIAENAHNKVYYYNLFGARNVFFYGDFIAKTSDDRDFQTSYHEGQFKGLGAVDHYMRSQNLRAPSSIVVDQ